MAKQSKNSTPPGQSEATEQSGADSDAVAAADSSPVDPTADTVPAKPGAMRRDALEGQPTEEPEATSAPEPEPAPADAPEQPRAAPEPVVEAEPAAVAQAPEEAFAEPEPTSEPVYAVAPSRGLTSLRGVLGEGEAVSARDFMHGQETLDHLVEVGAVLKS